MSRVERIYLVHHSHTDIGYTHDQPVLWDLETRFIDDALEISDKYAGEEDDRAFFWTVEATKPLLLWLEHAAERQVERFMALERAGRIEVTAMFGNMSPLLDIDEYIESLQTLRTLRGTYGFRINHAMNCDVDGANWPLVDVLLDAGVESFSMAINEHFGGSPFTRPNAFWWEGPSGRRILSWNGWGYGHSLLQYGIGVNFDRFENVWWPKIDRHLETSGYDLPVLMIQCVHPFIDNGTAFADYVDWINTWNKEHERPKLRLATPSTWRQALLEHADRLPSHRGDWTDYWNFGCISSAREESVSRITRSRLRTADAIAGGLTALEKSVGERARVSYARYRDKAWHSLLLWHEHTWGADCSIALPESEDARSQWNHKANYAYTARSLSLLLQRDAVAALASTVTRERDDDILVFNPLPWTRQVTGLVATGALRPRGRAHDITAARHFQDRMLLDTVTTQVVGDVPWFKGTQPHILRPVEVPAYGYAVVPQSEVVKPLEAAEVVAVDTIENERFRLIFDLEKGGIRSWHDKALAREWVDQSAGYPAGAFVYERVSDDDGDWPRGRLFKVAGIPQEVHPPRGWQPDWPAARHRPNALLDHKVYRCEIGQWVVQSLSAPGVDGPLVQSYFLPSAAPYVECESWWNMGLSTHPEATYLLFPFDVPGGVARVDLGGHPMVIDQEQLPGVCRDYFTAQYWVDFSNGEVGVTIALPENPMVQIGDFHFAHNQQKLAPERAMLLGWVTNNYWDTNFRAHQPGKVRARYRILPYQGPFDEARAHRFGLEAMHAAPVVQHMGEPRAQSEALPRTASLLAMPEPPILTLRIKPADTWDSLVIRLFNASDEPSEAVIGSGALRIRAAHRLDAMERGDEPVAVDDGRITLEIPPRRTATLRVEASAGS